MAKILTDIHKMDVRKWSDFVDEHSNGNIFQTPDIVKFYQEYPMVEPVVLMAINDSEEPEGLLVAFIQYQYRGFIGKLTSRSIIWGGPVINGDKPEVYKSLLKTYGNVVGKRAIYTEIRNLWDTADYKNSFSSLKYRFVEHLNIHVDLSVSEEQLWKNLHSKRRNEIRKAYKNHLDFKLGQNGNELKESYHILKEVYQRAKMPLPNFQYFSLMQERLNHNTRLLNFLAIKENQIIGCMIALSYKDVIYDFYAGAYKQYYKDHPNDMIPWEVFKWAKRNHYRLFDFGGAGKPDEAYGVRDYKKKYGGDFVNYGRYYKIHRPALYKIAKAGFSIWQKFR